MEQSRDPSMQPSTELPLDYSSNPYKEEGTEQVGNTGVQEGEEATWELSGEPSTESTPKPSVEPSKEPTQESTTEISGKTNFVFDCPCYCYLNFVTPPTLPALTGQDVKNTAFPCSLFLAGYLACQRSSHLLLLSSFQKHK